MFTDMVGYTALGQRNESLSLALLEEQRKLIRPLLRKHSGIEIKTMGDAFLIEFPNALDAARCAYDIQRTIREFNLSLEPEKRIHLRVGIHVGEVLEREGDISGDAVNVASRIEPLAEDGGVCLTRQVYDHIVNKIDIPLFSLGPKSLKNVANKLEVFRMVMPWEERGPANAAQLERQRIAVLPFSNISPDPADEFFADGLTEEVISKLSLVRGLKPIARTSVMVYKNKEKKISEIGSELGVGTIVEGSVRKSGKRIRVTVQLIDVRNEEHLWAESYDRNIEDIFDVQSEIATRVAESLPGALTPPKASLQRKGDTSNMTAYAQYLRAKQLRNRGTADSLRQALELLVDATKLDPEFARAYVDMGNCFFWLGVKSGVTYEESFHGMRSAARKAIEIDPELAEGHALLATLAYAEDELVVARAEAEKALELNPNLAEAYYTLALVKMTNGYLKTAVKLLEKAHELDPLSSEVIWSLGRSYFYSGLETEALDFWHANRRFAPYDVSRSIVEYYMAKGDLNEAEKEVEQLRTLAPEEAGPVMIAAEVAALRGDAAEAGRLVGILRTRYGGGPAIERNIGYIKYLLGDVDGYFGAMFKAADDHVLDPGRYRYSPLFSKARLDPRYPEVLARIGLDPAEKD